MSVGNTEAVEESDKSTVTVGDILFASIAPLGRCYFIQQAPADWDINESVFSIRSKTDTITPEFMYLYFKSDNFIQKATNTSTGSIFKGIRINTLLNTALIVPEFQVCKSFTDTVKPLFAEINNNYSETAKLTAAIRAAIISAISSLFHGLRVLYAWTEPHAAAVCRVGFDAVAVETSVCRVQRREQVVAHNRGGKRVGSQIGLHGHERQASAWQVGQVEQLERTDRTTLGGCYGRE